VTFIRLKFGNTLIVMELFRKHSKLLFSWKVSHVYSCEARPLVKEAVKLKCSKLIRVRKSIDRQEKTRIKR
jgi:hypothetical protein